MSLVTVLSDENQKALAELLAEVALLVRDLRSDLAALRRQKEAIQKALGETE